jgi:hypothetical protein
MRVGSFVWSSRGTFGRLSSRAARDQKWPQDSELGDTMPNTLTKPQIKLQPKTQRPKLYKVILLNDDYTPNAATGPGDTLSRVAYLPPVLTLAYVQVGSVKSSHYRTASATAGSPP